MKAAGPMQINYIPVEMKWNVGMHLCGIQIKESRNGEIIGREVQRSYWQGAEVILANVSSKIYTAARSRKGIQNHLYALGILTM